MLRHIARIVDLFFSIFAFLTISLGPCLDEPVLLDPRLQIPYLVPECRSESIYQVPNTRLARLCQVQSPCMGT